VSFAGAIIGWAMVVLTSWIERRRQQRHTERFGQSQVPESPDLMGAAFERRLGLDD
jgi:hypothetical protein